MTSSPDARRAALRASLGILPAWLRERGLVEHEEASRLEVVEVNAEGRRFELAPAAAAAWRRMKAAAAADGVVLVLESAYRSVERQAEIVSAKLAAGERIEDVLRFVAPPGCSEHHTGRAVDIGTPGSVALEEVFETTSAFAWLQRHAAAHGFTMSYPRGNGSGYAYEPWHWCHREGGG